MVHERGFRTLPFVFLSPLLPSHEYFGWLGGGQNYSDDLNKKEYRIRVAIGKKVELTIEDQGIESCEDCNHCDHLEIYDTPVDGSQPTLLDVSH